MKRRSDPDAVAELIGDLSRALVDSPERVTVKRASGATVTILEIQVGPDDVGRLVGRGGRSVSALRQLLYAIGGRTGTKYTLQILEPDRKSCERKPALNRTKPEGTAQSQPDRIHAFNQDPVQTTGDLLVRLARALVDHDDQVKVVPLVGSQAAVYELHVDQRDVPRVLGRGGRTATAVRELGTSQPAPITNP